jgi:hypothetical protein
VALAPMLRQKTPTTRRTWKMTDLPWVEGKIFLDIVKLPRVGECLMVTLEDFAVSDINEIKSLKGAKFVAPKDGGPGFRFKLDLDIAKDLRAVFEDRLVLKKKLKKWAEKKITTASGLVAMNGAEDAELTLLPDLAPDLFALTDARRWQRADIKFGAEAAASLNCNEPGLGKTVETIGSVIEGGLMDRSNLAIAPVSSLETVWWHHLATYQPHDVLVVPEGLKQRIRVMQIAAEYHAQGEPFWLVCNPAMFTLRSKFAYCDTHLKEQKETKKKTPAHVARVCEGCEEEIYTDFPEFQEIQWGGIILDEFHLCGLGNPNSKTYHGLKRLEGEKKIATSGTPIGGKPIKLYGALSWLFPNDFTSKWDFADRWLQVDVVKTAHGNHKRAQGLNPHREQQFYEMMSAYMVRRLKEDVAKDLIPPVITDIYVDMDPRQQKQYDAFALDAEVRIDEYELSAVGILAEYSRLKQFANAEQTVDIIPAEDPDYPPKIELHPTYNSSKLPQVLRILKERGISKDDEEEGGDEQVIIFSESTRMVNMVSRWLREQGVPNEVLTGETTRTRRTVLQRAFQEGELRVLCMNTKAGGVAITLDRANTVIILDETWNPDDQKQAIDRAHRLSRIHMVEAIFIRSKNSIQEFIEKRVLDKSEINTKVIDFRKAGLFTPKGQG